MSKWLCNMIVLTIALSLGPCSLNANASDTDTPYVQENDDEEDTFNKDIMTYYSGFDYAYCRLSLVSGCYSAAIQQSCLASLTEEEAKNIDDVLSRTFNLLEKYEIALDHRDFEECKHIINELSLSVPDIKSSLVPVLVPDSLIGSPLVFDEEGLVSDEKGFLTKQGEHVTIIDGGFLTSKNPSSIEELNKWFGLLGEDFTIPFCSLNTDSKAICQLPIIDSETFYLYGYMIVDVSKEFSIDSYTISIVDGKYMVGEEALRELTDDEKELLKDIAMVVAAVRGEKVDLDKFIEAVNNINTKFSEVQIEKFYEFDYSEGDMLFEDEFEFPNDNLSYKKIKI